MKKFLTGFMMVFMTVLYGCGGSSSSAPTAPAAPTGVTAAPAAKQATIAWTAVPGATSYNVYWSTTTGVTPTNGTKITGATNASAQTELTNGTTYYYVVTAVNSIGESAPSAQVSCQLASPVAPTNDTATSGNTQATIAWTAAAGAASYNIYWSTTTGVTTANGTKITGAANPYTQSGLSNGTTYYYVVTAVNPFGESAASAQASATPSALPVPAAPTGVIATVADGQETLAWTAVPGATSYNIYESTTPGVTPANGNKIAGATNPYTKTGLTNGTTYYCVVTAVNANGESTASAQVSGTPTATAAARFTLAMVNGKTFIYLNPTENNHNIPLTFSTTGAVIYPPTGATMGTWSINASGQLVFSISAGNVHMVTFESNTGVISASEVITGGSPSQMTLSSITPFTTSMLAGHTVTDAGSSTRVFTFAVTGNTVTVSGNSGTWAINSNGTLTMTFPSDSLTYFIVSLSGNGLGFGVLDVHAATPTTVEGPDTWTIQ
jgi:hypothetical protein